MRRAYLMVFVAVALVSPFSDTSAAAGSIVAVPPAEYRPAQAAAKAAPALVAPDAPAYRVVLPAPGEGERESLKVMNAKRAEHRRAGRPTPTKSRPLAIGYPRELPEASRRLVLSDLVWKALPDGGRATRIEVLSPGAAALRLSLSLPTSDPDLSLRFVGSDPRAQAVGAIPANAVAQAATRGGAYWTPVLEGERATIELHAAAGASLDGLALTLGPISHLVVAGGSLDRIDAKRAEDIGEADSCNIDFACVTPQTTALTRAADAVGKIVFTDRYGGTIVCTATMLNDSVMSFTPYLFTAAHCIEDAYNASTVNVYWFFRAQTCNSLGVPPYALQTGGAMLLARSDDYDWSLLRLYSPPPAGVRFSAWRAEPVSDYAIATTLHHPEGDLLMWSEGSMLGHYSFDDGSSFMQMRWSQGTTEIGSSGSGLFTYLASGGYYELRGGLFGGDASCGNPSGIDYFSRLDTMLPVTRQYLTPGTANPGRYPVAVEYYHRGLDHYFVTSSEEEINDLDRGYHGAWERTGVRFIVHGSARPNANPVCRYYLPQPGNTHFYSADPTECQWVESGGAGGWQLESIGAFYVELPDRTTGACASGTRPVWRFWNNRTPNHRFTPEVMIRDELRADPAWKADDYGKGYPVYCVPNDSDE